MESQDTTELLEQLDYLDKIILESEGSHDSSNHNEEIATTFMLKTIQSNIWNLYGIKSGKGRPTIDLTAFLATESGGALMLDKQMGYLKSLMIQIRSSLTLIDRNDIQSLSKSMQSLDMSRRLLSSLSDLKKVKDWA